MNITEIKLRKAETAGRARAIASVTFDDEFVVHDIKVLESNDGNFFIAMPSKRMSDGNFKDIAHPINAEFRKYIQDNVVEAYKNADFKE